MKGLSLSQASAMSCSTSSDTPETPCGTGTPCLAWSHPAATGCELPGHRGCRARLGASQDLLQSLCLELIHMAEATSSYKSWCIC